jgi:hypothetical protein
MPSICDVPVVSSACSAVSSGVSSVTGDFIQTAATDAAKAADSLLKTLASAWTNIPTPSLTPGSAQGSTVQFLQGDLKYLTLWVGVASLLVAAARMAYLRKADPLREAGVGLLRLLLVGSMGIAAVNIFASIGDQFSSYVLGSATGTNAGDLNQATSLFNLSGTTGFGTVPFLLLILAILALVATLVQLFLIIIRGALLVVLVGTWPIAAAASMTPSGSQWFKKITGYLVAFLLYKPAAAICYAAAFKLIESPNSDPVVAQLEGVVLIILATLTLPALLKFVVPAVASAGGVGAGEAMAAGAALATGAAVIVGTGGTGAAAGAGAAGTTGASGAAGAAAPAGASAAGGGAAKGGAPAGIPPTGGGGSDSEGDLVSASMPTSGDPPGGGGTASGAPAQSGASGSPSGGGSGASGARDASRAMGDAASTASGSLNKSMGDEDDG